jgi:hypothetical protein
MDTSSLPPQLVKTSHKMFTQVRPHTPFFGLADNKKVAFAGPVVFQNRRSDEDRTPVAPGGGKATKKSSYDRLTKV